MSGDRTVKVTLSAQVQGYVDGMNRAAKATRETGSEAEKLAQKGDAIQKLGQASVVAGGAMVAGAALAARAAADWEAAWAGVTKTVEGTPEQMAAIEDGLRGLAKELPSSHAEIAAVAEAAGQLGVKTGDVLGFTKVMIDLGETTNLTADAAATSLAQFMNIMGTSGDVVSNLGATLVALGNDGASTEAEIVQMAQRIAGAGKLVGASEGEVLALSNALASMGVSAELGGGVISRVLQDVYTAVKEGGDGLSQFAGIAGMSGKEFATAFENDPVRALASFTEGLNGVETSGGNVVQVLSDMGFKSSEEQRILLQMKSASDLVTDSLDLQSQAWEDNNALQNEAEKRYETTAAKLEITRNQMNDMFIVLGENLLPVVGAGADLVGDMADAVGGLEGPMSAVVTWAGLIIGTGILGAGLWMVAVPKIAEYKTALDTLEITGSKLHKTLGAVGKVVGAAAVWTILITLAKEAEANVTGLNNAMERNADAQTVLAEAANADMERGWAGGVAQLRETETSLDAVSVALDKAAAYQENFWGVRPVGDSQKTLSALRTYGDELGNLAGQSLPAAQEALTQLSDEYAMTESQQWAFIQNSSKLKDALESQAGSMGLSTDKADLLKLAFGGVETAAGDVSGAVELNVDELAQLEGKATSTEGAIDSLADAIRNFGSAELSVREANRELEAAFDDLSASVAENGATLDIGSEKGRANEAALDAVALATLEASAATLELTGSEEAANAKLAEGRQRLVEMLAQFGITGAEAEAYADKLGLIPENLNTHAEITGTDEAAQKVQRMVDAFPKSFSMRALVEGAGEWQGVPFLKPDVNAGANGFIEAYANGGFASGIYKGGAPIHKFAEPETRWEAYISGKPGQEERNRQIWVDAGGRLGMDKLIGDAIRGALGGGQGATIHQTINTQPGMSGADVGRLSAEKINRQLRGME